MKKLIFILVALVAPIIVSAHMAAFELRAETGEYLLELVSDSSEFRAGVPVQLNFDLWTKDALTNLDGQYNRVWVKVAKGEDRLFSGWFAKPAGIPAGVNIGFPNEGTYEVTVRFMMLSGADMPEAKFQISVGASGERKISWPVVSSICSAVIAFTLGLLFARRRSRRHHSSAA
jgi:hypothetical protein